MKKKKTRFESSHHLVSRLEIVGRGSNLVTHTLLHLIFITILGNRQNDHLYFRKEKLRCQAIGLNLIADLRDSKAYALNRCTCLGNMGTSGMWGFSCSWVTPLFGYVGANRNNSWDIFSNILALQEGLLPEEAWGEAGGGDPNQARLGKRRESQNLGEAPFLKGSRLLRKMTWWAEGCVLFGFEVYYDSVLGDLEKRTSCSWVLAC